MTSGKFLLDTNIIIALFGGDPSVCSEVKKASEIYVPLISIGEMYYGAEKSNRISENIQLLDEFAAASRLLTIDLETSRQYGRIKSALKVKGCPLPENDIWISAISMRHSVTLVTRDKHFLEIEGLTTERW